MHVRHLDFSPAEGFSSLLSGKKISFHRPLSASELRWNLVKRILDHLWAILVVYMCIFLKIHWEIGCWREKVRGEVYEAARDGCFLVCFGLWLPKVEWVAVEPKKLLWVFKARGSVLIWDHLAKFKVIFVHLRKTLPYKLSICFHFAVALCFLASLRRRWHYNVVICCFGTDPFYPGVTSTPSKSRDVPMQKTPVVLQNSRYFDYIIHQSLMYLYES